MVSTVIELLSMLIITKEVVKGTGNRFQMSNLSIVCPYSGLEKDKKISTNGDYDTFDSNYQSRNFILVQCSSLNSRMR